MNGKLSWFALGLHCSALRVHESIDSTECDHVWVALVDWGISMIFYLIKLI